MTDRKVFVYVDLGGEQYLVGTLWARNRKGRESASFKYDKSWLEHANSFSLEPLLILTEGDYHTTADKALFGSIGDSAPDRWGRILMRRGERRRTTLEGGSARTLMEIDYLLAVNDEARQGALRFSEEEGVFLAAEGSIPIPPLVDLPRLLSATESLLSDQESDEDLQMLLAPGASLGGARPKASIRDRDGTLLIAKFPHNDDEFQAVLWEALALTLAADAGIDIPNWRLEEVAGKQVLMLERFDRINTNERVPFLSAMSMLGAKDNEEHSYLEIVDAITKYGSEPSEDKENLWRRIVFSILISNTDDHLRNHAFLYDGQRGWRLSPAYDMNPTPLEKGPRILNTLIDLDDGTASLDLALSVIEDFGVELDRAHSIIQEVGMAVSQWKVVASRLGLSKNEIDRMSSAFDHADLEFALNI